MNEKLNNLYLIWNGGPGSGNHAPGQGKGVGKPGSGSQSSSSSKSSSSKSASKENDPWLDEAATISDSAYDLTQHMAKVDEEHDLSSQSDYYEKLRSSVAGLSDIIAAEYDEHSNKKYSDEEIEDAISEVEEYAHKFEYDVGSYSKEISAKAKTIVDQAKNLYDLEH